MDVKPSMNRLGVGGKGVEPEYSSREFPSNGEGYLPSTTSGQQWHYSHQQMLSVPTPTNPYLGHDRGYQINNGGREVTSEEFSREAGEEGGEGMEGMKVREEIGHYDPDMISQQTGPIRGYTRADAFVWRPY